MTYVTDSSVGFKWLLTEHLSDKAQRLLNYAVSAAVELIAPDIFPIEVTHALTRAERQGRITPAQGGVLFAALLAPPPLLRPSLPLLPRAYALSSQYRIGVYDCVYVALAEQEGCEFVTADDKLVRNLQPHFPFIVPLAALP